MNEQTSEERFEKWNNITLTKYELNCAKSAWQAQEAYWSKRCEEMEKALEAHEWFIKAMSYDGFFMDGQEDKWEVVNPENDIGYKGSTPLEAIQNAMKSSL